MRILFLRAAALLCLLVTAASPAAAQCPAKTTVADTLHNADGSPAAGRVIISWPTFHAGACAVVAGQLSVTVTNGALSVLLYPNDAATPAGTSYRVQYALRSGRVSTEYWVVPASATPVALATVRSPTVPVPALMVSQAQVMNLTGDLARKVELPAPCAAGKFLQSSGASIPPQVDCVDAPSGSGGAVSSVFGRTGAVAAQGGDYDWNQIAGKPATFPPDAHGHAIADVASLQSELDGKAALDAFGKVVQDPASAQTAPAASKIPLADGAGNIADGWLSASVSLLGASIGTAEIEDAAVTRDKVSAALRTRQIVFLLGADNGAALADADDQKTIYRNSLGSGITLTEVWCQSDSGTPSINLQRNDGSPANILTSNLSCSTSGATGALDATEKLIAAGHTIDFVMVSAGGTARRVTLVITFTLD